MRALIFVVCSLLASCGSREDDDANGYATTNQIERLSTPKEDRRDPQASARLERITPVDMEREGLTGIGCNFSRDDRMYLAAVGNRAIVRIAGRIRHLVQSGPVARSGGYFQDRDLSVSIGRTDDATEPAGASSWPARITVTNQRTEVQRRQRGLWTCAG